MPYFEKGLKIETKDNGTYVTEADRDAEVFIRAKILENFPDDGIIGEEFPEQNKKGEFTWTIDPIDGTSSFIHQVPLFGTMIGLLDNNENALLGVIHMPALSETIYAQKGKGTFWSPANSKEFIRAQVGNKSKLDECTFSYSAAEYFEMNDELELLDTLRKNIFRERVWGDCYGHILAATGRIDIMVDPGLEIWDLVPIKIITEEAGGEFFGIDKGVGVNCKGGISTNSNLKEQLLKIL